MQYTINIEDSDPMGNHIIGLLKELAKEYACLEVAPMISTIEENIANELDSRHKYVLENPEKGDSWENVKARLLAR